MKKIICLLLAAVSVVSLSACSKDPGETNQPTNESVTVKNWPYTEFFKDIPVIGGDIYHYTETKDDKGYIYTFLVNDIDYQGLKDYVKQLETAGFSIYHANPLDTETTDDRLPDTLEEGTYTKSWSGKRRGVYVAINWYADEHYKENNLPDSFNVSLRFYTYNIFDTTTK